MEFSNLFVTKLENGKIVPICTLQEHDEKLLFEFANYISDYFDNPALYNNPGKLMEMYKEHLNNNSTPD